MAQDKTIWSVGGGEGGIGKSVIAANLGCALAEAGRKVILVDAGPGGANLPTYFGIKGPSKGLDDFLKGRVSDLGEVAISTPLPGLKLISGAGEFPGIANPAWAQRQKLISGMKNLEAEFIIADLGEGSSRDVLDFFAMSDEGIVVVVPEPAAVQNAYSFLKSFVYRRLKRLFAENEPVTALIKEATDARSPGAVKSFSGLCERIAAEDGDAAMRAIEEMRGFRPRIVLNMAKSSEDVLVAEAFMAAAKSFLGLETGFAGTLFSRPSIDAAARKMCPFMLDATAIDARRDIEAIINNLLPNGPEHEIVPEIPAGEAIPEAREREVFGFNDNLSHNGAVFHVQTEARSDGEPFIETVVYNGGRIFFSKRTLWKEAGAGDLSMRDFALRQHRAAMAAIKLDRIKAQG